MARMWLKKLTSAFLLPYPIAIALLIVGLVLLWFTQRQRLGKILSSVSVVMLLLGGYDVLSGPLILPLERPFSPLSAEMVAAMTPAPAAIVVLGSGFRTDKTLPPNDRLSSNGIARLTEAVRLAHILPAARLILSDGVGQGESLAQTAMIMGVPRERITLEGRSGDTSDEAALLPPLVGKEPFLLVTSAAHMRRAMALCRKQGLNPIAAATDFTHASVEWSAGDLLPRAEGFLRADYALHEWIGYWWSGLRGTI
jgi:uncharacterized SAM-binding protein YcdF (DUF218 family)